MIKLTKLNGEEFVVNAELIRFIESRPDTYVTLTSNDRLIVRESVDEVVRRSLDYSRTIRMLGPFDRRTDTPVRPAERVVGHGSATCADRPATQSGLMPELQRLR